MYIYIYTATSIFLKRLLVGGGSTRRISLVPYGSYEAFLVFSEVVDARRKLKEDLGVFGRLLQKGRASEVLCLLFLGC